MKSHVIIRAAPLGGEGMWGAEASNELARKATLTIFLQGREGGGGGGGEVGEAVEEREPTKSLSRQGRTAVTTAWWG